ncbi:pirin family protein [Streptomyces sp. GSL17-111]|uniref:pirin family protein n=1 Tax=Streptomyces sp. GSL17-111 TaxID=3121596 RepID=UPI0030F3D2BC
MNEDAAQTGPAVYACTLGAAEEPDSLLLPGHDVPLGRYTTVRRLLPHRERRMIGAWCFADHFGPDDVAERPGMQIAPHPHTGLQTVTWLVEGEIVHADSLGSLQPIVPGALNLMTSGHGISHSEQSPPDHPPVMHGLQLWIALPDDARHQPPRFEHHADLPTVRDGAATVTVVVGELAGARSPARVHSPLLGAEVSFDAPGILRLPVDPAFETGALILSGRATVAGTELAPGALLHLGQGRTEVTVEVTEPARIFLLGGTPFEEPLVMWWNFVGRTHEEIVRARDDWEAGGRFGTVEHCADAPLPAPALPTVRLKPRSRTGDTR